MEQAKVEFEEASRMRAAMEQELGRIRQEMLRYKDALEMEMMRSIKRTFDPQGLMNPGKVL